MSDVCVKVFKDLADAEMFKEFLTDHAISSFIKEKNDESHPHLEEDLHGYHLMVPREEMEQAKLMIEESCEEEDLFADV